MLNRRASSRKSQGADFFMAIRDEHLSELTLRRLHDPIPYSADIEYITPSDSEHVSVPLIEASGKKVTIVGCGQVGLAIAYAMINQEIASSIALVDMMEEKLEGEARDLRQGAAFHSRTEILSSSGYEITANSRLVIITAGCARKPGEARLNLMQRNVSVMKSIIPQVLKYSPYAAICIISNPCDIMTAVAAKVAGPSVPPGRIFGSGTCLDSSRLRSLVAHALGIDAQSTHGYVVGEHGDSQVCVWSSVRVGGVPLLKYGEEPGEAHESVHKEILMSGSEVIKRKGYTNWAIGMTVAHIAKCVLDDARRIMPVSTCVRGLDDITEDVFLSLPCVVGALGVENIVDLKLSPSEKAALQASAEKVWDIQKEIWNDL
jgi:L-lactate dehydrogenase